MLHQPVDLGVPFLRRSNGEQAKSFEESARPNQVGFPRMRQPSFAGSQASRVVEVAIDGSRIYDLHQDSEEYSHILVLRAKICRNAVPIAHQHFLSGGGSNRWLQQGPRRSPFPLLLEWRIGSNGDAVSMRPAPSMESTTLRQTSAIATDRRFRKASIDGGYGMGVPRGLRSYPEAPAI